MLLKTKEKIVNNFLMVIFVGVNLLFVFFQIHKQSQLVKLSYGKQRLEKEQERLIKLRNDLAQQIHVQQSSKLVKKYAINKLDMHDTGVSQIHKIVLTKSLADETD